MNISQWKARLGFWMKRQSVISIKVVSEDNLYKAEFKQTPGCAFKKKNIKTLKLRQISSMNDSRKKLMILVILLLKMHKAEVIQAPLLIFLLLIMYAFKRS